MIPSQQERIAQTRLPRLRYALMSVGLIMNITGVVLAGGQSKRMGTDKAALILEGETLLQRSQKVLQCCFGETVVIREDDQPAWGPLGGIITAMHQVSSEAVFVVACDMPFLDAALIRDLCHRLGDADAVAIKEGGRFEPLHAAYRCALSSQMEAQARRGDLSLQRFLEGQRVNIVSAGDLERYPHWRRALTNLNTPADWQRWVK